MKLNKTKVYSLEELTGEEKQQLLKKLRELDDSWVGKAPRLQLFSSKYLYYTNSGWFVSDEIYYTGQEIVNAKELFYTLENIQIDCTFEKEEQINNMFEVVRSNGFQTCTDTLITESRYVFFRQGNTGYKFGIFEKDLRKHTITYDKFMELFTEPQHEVTEKPKHYSKGIDTFARCESNMTKEEILACCKFNIDKYVWREKGQDLEDYKKIVSYANWAIKLLKDEK